MNPPKIIHGWEHHAIVDWSENLRQWLTQKGTHWQRKETLGLHEKHGGYAPGNFIGMVWLGKGNSRVVLQVDSKFEEMDYIAMFAECAAHPIIGEKLNCLHFWTEQDFIPIPQTQDFSILVAISYLRELNELCRRHLRRHFLREQQNFVGKVKGKVIIKENLRQNMSRCRPDRIFCEYQSVSDDILENRILRAALERASRYIADYRKINGNNILQQWIRSCRAGLQGVSVVPIKRAEFSAARKRGAFAFYAKPLTLAKAVLLNLGLNPHAEIETNTKTPPFALNSAELFERYAEIKLLQKYETLKACYNTDISGGNEGFTVNVRPDFYVPFSEQQQPQIIDAKYKDIRKYKHPMQNDIYQVVAYSCHKRLLEKMECEENNNIKLGLAYPDVQDRNDIDMREKTAAFLSDLHVYKIPCPIKPQPKGD